MTPTHRAPAGAALTRLRLPAVAAALTVLLAVLSLMAAPSGPACAAVTFGPSISVREGRSFPLPRAVRSARVRRRPAGWLQCGRGQEWLHCMRRTEVPPRLDHEPLPHERYEVPPVGLTVSGSPAPAVTNLAGLLCAGVRWSRWLAGRGRRPRPRATTPLLIGNIACRVRVARGVCRSVPTRGQREKPAPSSGRGTSSTLENPSGSSAAAGQADRS